MLSDPSQALSPLATAINAAVWGENSEYALAHLSLGNCNATQTFEKHLIFGGQVTNTKNLRGKQASAIFYQNFAWCIVDMWCFVKI